MACCCNGAAVGTTRTKKPAHCGNRSGLSWDVPEGELVDTVAAVTRKNYARMAGDARGKLVSLL